MIDKKYSLKTLDILAIACIIGYFVSNLKLFLFASLFFLCANVISSRLSLAIENIWLKFAYLIGNINSKILLVLIFFLFLTPIAFMFRLFNKHKVKYFFDKNKSSFFIERNYTFDKNDFEKSW